MKRSAYLLLLLSFSIVTILSSCKEKERKTSIERSSGSTAEVLIVMEDELWKGMVGETMRKSLTQDVAGMPQSEKMFDLIQMNPKAFIQMYQRHHNIIIVQEDNSLDTLSVETKEDYWASPQRLIRLRAPSRDALVEAYIAREPNIIELLKQSERARLSRLFDEIQNQKVRTQLMEKMKLKMSIPGGFYVAKMTSEFAWLRKETKDFSQGMIIYFTPYEDTSYFNPQLIINRRNQMCMLYVPGELEGSYMQTAESFPPESQRIVFNGDFAVETRGLWDVKGDFMGGPFLNYAILDEENNRIISLDSYVYYPNNEKRDLMLQMEAVMYTLDY